MRGRRTGGQASRSHDALIRELFAEHGRAVLAYATRLTGDRAAAEDVVQETLLRAWRHPQVAVNGRGSVRGWLLTVARNIVIDQFRARAARPNEVGHCPPVEPAHRDHADAVVASVVVTDALRHLSAEHREILTEIYLRGSNVNEAATALGIPAGTVKSRTYYALRALRDLIGEPPVPVRISST